jgi:CBS domain-containing protein
MTVAAILAAKGRRVVTIPPTMPALDVAQTLSDWKIGAVVVVDEDETPIGIVSERDIVRALSKLGADALAQEAEAIMTAKLVTCEEHHTVDQVMERMTRGRFRHLPVMQDSRLVGIVSIGDVVKRRIEDVEKEAQEMRTYIATA